MFIIKTGTLHPPSDSQDGILTFQADILVENGRISAIGTDLSAPEGCETVDAAGLHIYP